jgi:hypothetical protein
MIDNKDLPGPGAAGKTKVAGTVEMAAARGKGRRLGRLRFVVAAAETLARSFQGSRPKRPQAAAVRTDARFGYAGLDAASHKPRGAIDASHRLILIDENKLSCPVDTGAKSFEFSQDGAGDGGPDERFAGLV